MNYRKLYESIIDNARRKEFERVGEYTERHHIVPKSLGGGNSKGNLIKLTAREHFVCHWLLVKMHKIGSEERNKMMYAFFFMRFGSKDQIRYSPNSRVFEKYKLEMSKILISDRTTSDARKRWDRFHSGNWKSLSDFDKAEGRSVMTTCMLFNDRIPIYNRLKVYSKYRRFSSDPFLVGVYL